MEILFQDKNIAVCFKPAGIVSQSTDGGNDMISLLNEVFEKNGEEAFSINGSLINRVSFCVWKKVSVL